LANLNEPNLNEIPHANEFPEVSNQVHGFSPDREIEFAIN